MGLTQGTLPPVDAATFPQLPYRERLKITSRHWAEYGFGGPKILPILYFFKLMVFSVFGGWLVATLTTGLNPFEFAAHWDEPIVWQKLVLWTMLIEALGVAGAWGPLCGHFKPMTGGIAYYARRRTLRQPPWADKVPGTAGDERTALDVALFLGFVGSMVLCLAMPGSAFEDVTAAIGANEGLIPVAPLVAVLVFNVLLGLRDKIAWLQARSEQYIPATIFFAFFPFVDMIVAAKILIVGIWVCAAISKIGHHFGNVIPPMVSNTPWLASKKIKLLHYRNFPNDLRPSKGAVRLAHGPGSIVEFAVPLILLFSHDSTLTLVAVIVMLGFHTFIISTFPLAVPLEWNALFMYVAAFLFLGFPAQDGYALGDMDTALLALTVAGVLLFPIIGNNRPDLVSFLPSMRQYAGNWASALWAFAPGREKVLDEKLHKPALMQREQLKALYSDDEAELIMQQLLGWRAMHSQGRGLNSVLMNVLGDDIDRYTIREAEFSCNAIVGFNFGDGHLHDHKLIEAIQRRCRFEPGEFIVVWVESEPILRGTQQYMVIDAAVGIVERGEWRVRDCVDAQPWLPDGPVPVNVKWRMPGYERVSHAGGGIAGDVSATNGKVAKVAQVTA